MAEEIAKRQASDGLPAKAPEVAWRGTCRPPNRDAYPYSVFNALRRGTVYKPARDTILPCHLSDSRGFQGRKVWAV